MLLNTGGEACYLLKRLTRANEPATFRNTDRKVSTITKTASAYIVDSDTGYYAYKMWGANVSQVDEYPDVGVFTCTVQASGGSSVWEPAVDKYSFIPDRSEYAFDIIQDKMDSDGNAIEDALYIVFNTPPFNSGNSSIFNFGTINPLVDVFTMQPVRDNQQGFQYSLWAFDQWLSVDARIRTRRQPHRMLLAFPGTLGDITIEESGVLKHSNMDHWTNAPPYSPILSDGDMIVRESSKQRFHVANYTPIYLEKILVSQHFNLVEIDPLSTLYDVEVNWG